MKTLILPGNSIGNKKWAEGLEISDKEVWNWTHWETGIEADIDVDLEVQKIFSIHKGQKYNVLAKSIGSLVLMRLFDLGFEVNKFVLCGIPLKVIRERGIEEDYQKLLKVVPELIIQNSQDPLGSYTEVAEFIQNINPNITVISKEADNHSYPYPNEFNKYLI
jgi:hypothetical protein